MILHAPPWLARPRHSAWWLIGVLALASAAIEAGVAAWIRGIGSIASARDAAPWLAGLAVLLAGRLLLVWWREDRQERLALQAVGDVRVRLWNAPGAAMASDALDRLGREPCDALEAGTRAAIALRSAAAGLVVLLPAMFLFAPRLALAAILVPLPLALAARWKSRRIRRLQAVSQRRQARRVARQGIAWSALPEAAPARRGSWIARRMRGEERRAGRDDHHAASRIVALQALGEGVAHLAALVLAALALREWMHGRLSAGDFVGFAALSLLAYRPVREVGRNYPAWMRALVAWDEIARRLAGSIPQALRPDAKPEPCEGGSPVRSPAAPFPPRRSEPDEHPSPAAGPDEGAAKRSAPVLSWSGLGFSYGAKAVLHGHSGALGPGDVAWIQGPNGSGKSTLLALLAGHLAPASGTLRRPPDPVTWVSQDPVWPPISLRAWTGLPALPAAGPQREAWNALVGTFAARLPWDVALEAGGRRFSRGQRARLSLAAAILRPACVWLLDEPLAALPHSERQPLLRLVLACRGRAAVAFASHDALEGFEWRPAAAAPRGPLVRTLAADFETFPTAHPPARTDVPAARSR